MSKLASLRRWQADSGNVLFCTITVRTGSMRAGQHRMLRDSLKKLGTISREKGQTPTVEELAAVRDVDSRIERLEKLLAERERQQRSVDEAAGRSEANLEAEAKAYT